MGSSSPTEAELQTRIRQQEVITDLGQQALATDELDELMHDATVAVAETLDAEYCHVLELLPDGGEFLLRQGVGWQEGTVGNATVPTEQDSQAGYTLLSREPIIVDDLRSEDRFTGNELLVDHGVVSGITVLVGSIETPWGVLGTFTTEGREFTAHDANFVQSAANILASVIENKRTESELEEIYGRISDAFIALDDDWRFVHLNERAHEMINPDGRELVGRNVWEEFPAAIEREFKPKYEQAMYEQETVTFEEYYPAPLDVWVEVRAYPSETGLSVYFRDVTDRKEREQELELFRTLLEHSTDSVLVVDPETGQYLDVNETACRRRGYSREEFLQLTVPDLETELPDLEAWQSFVEDLKGERRITFNGKHRRKDGSTYPVEVNATYLELDREYVLAMARDVTERRVRERELEQYHALTQAATDVIVTIDEQSIIQAVNPSVVDVFGYDQEELVGESLTVLMPDDFADRHREAIERYLETGQRTIDWDYVELPGEHADGSAIPLAVSFSDVKYEDDRYFTGVLRDITERKEIERQLEASNERLEQFASAVSHDLQEPLRMVTSYLELIERRYGDVLDEEGEEFLEFAVDGADRMRAMIDGLLEYSRVETQGNPFEPIDLEAVLDDVLADLQFRIEESNAEITAESLPRVEGDASQLRQVFQNLLSNAIEYSGNDPPRIHVAAKQNGAEWIVSVRDEGIGLESDGAERVFEVFQRLHADDEHSGIGIGLALCKKIIERHDGEIWVESDPGEGSTFSFTLPAESTHSP